MADEGATESFVLEDGRVSDREVLFLRDAVYRDGGVTRAAAEMLFRIKDAVHGAENSALWDGLFAQAVADCVLSSSATRGAVDASEFAWLKEQVERCGQLDRAVLRALSTIFQRAVGSSEEYIAWALDVIERSVVADGVVDVDEVAIVRAVIFGQGGSSGMTVDRVEADFLFRLQAAVADGDNAEGWSTLFVDAICRHLLSDGDSDSPGSVDEAGAAWLSERVFASGGLDPLHRKLLEQLNLRAHSIPPELSAKLRSLGI